MSIKKYWKKNVEVVQGRFADCPRVVCADGFSMSVQASYFHYCSPRITDASCPYTSWEIGFPNRKEPLIAKYAEEPKRQTKTVYGWVPTKVINAVIKKHGGLK